MNSKLELMKQLKILMNKKDNIFVGESEPTDKEVLWIKPDLTNNTIGMYLYMSEIWTLMEGSVNLDLSNLSDNIVPNEAGTLDLGSEEKPFRTLYADEAKISANTLYIDGVPVLGSNSDTILIKADPDQGIQVGTTGTGATKMQSEANAEIITTGVGGNINIKTTGAGGNISLTSTGNINLTAQNIISDASFSIKDLVISNSLTVSGTMTTIDSVNMTVKDNIVELNNNETGSGVSLGQSGIKINRGDLDDVFIIFDETDDCFKVGTQSDLKMIATSEYVDSLLEQIDNHSHENAEILNKFSEDKDGNLLYKDERVELRYKNIEW